MHDGGMFPRHHYCTCSEDTLTAWHAAGQPLDLEPVVDAICQYATRSRRVLKFASSEWIEVPPRLEEIRRDLKSEAVEYRDAPGLVESRLAVELDAIVASMELS